MFSVYILKNNAGKHYIGFSEKPVNVRVAEHNQAKNRRTRHKGPWKVIHSETFETKQEALFREHQIKSYKGGRAFKELVKKALIVERSHSLV